MSWQSPGTQSAAAWPCETLNDNAFLWDEKSTRQLFAVQHRIQLRSLNCTERVIAQNGSAAFGNLSRGQGEKKEARLYLVVSAHGARAQLSRLVSVFVRVCS